MKNILAAAAAAFLLITTTGCSDFLDEDLKKELAPDNTYTSTYGFQVGVNGLYAWHVPNSIPGEVHRQLWDRLVLTDHSR